MRSHIKNSECSSGDYAHKRTGVTCCGSCCGLCSLPRSSLWSKNAEKIHSCPPNVSLISRCLHRSFFPRPVIKWPLDILWNVSPMSLGPTRLEKRSLSKQTSPSSPNKVTTGQCVWRDAQGRLGPIHCQISMGTYCTYREIFTPLSSFCSFFHVLFLVDQLWRARRVKFTSDASKW